jgi:hypothetical protein
MANSHNQAETRGAGGGFLMGLLVGTVLGAGLVMLLAPKADADLRGDIRRRARDRHAAGGVRTVRGKRGP